MYCENKQYAVTCSTWVWNSCFVDKEIKEHVGCIKAELQGKLCIV